MLLHNHYPFPLAQQCQCRFLLGLSYAVTIIQSAAWLLITGEIFRINLLLTILLFLLISHPLPLKFPLQKRIRKKQRKKNGLIPMLFERLIMFTLTRSIFTF
ncbi:hypothetical protein CQJ27_26220 [Escherichia sp. E1130]|nr:hypothetical protein CQJ27_26220 [Escherichia sp. E1130]